MLNDVDARERCVGASSKMNSLRALLGGTPPVVAHSKRTRVRGTRPKGPRQEAPLGQPQGGSPHHHGRHGCVGDRQSRVVPASKGCTNDRDPAVTVPEGFAKPTPICASMPTCASMLQVCNRSAAHQDPSWVGSRAWGRALPSIVLRTPSSSSRGLGQRAR